MNIFFTDRSPYHCAINLHDIHLRKMILETTQLMCTAHRILDGSDAKPYTDLLYKVSHVKHPCALWMREDKPNYVWTTKLLAHMLSEYSLRFPGRYLKKDVHAAVLGNIPANIKDMRSDISAPPACVPDRYRDNSSNPHVFGTNIDKVIDAYRAAYADVKGWNKNGDWMGDFTNRQPPSWWSNWANQKAAGSHFAYLCGKTA